MQAYNIHNFVSWNEDKARLKFLVESELEPAQDRSDKSDKNMPGKKQRERLARKQGLILQRMRKYSISMVKRCF